MKTKKITKPMLAMLLLLLIAGSCIGMTLAFLTADSGEVVNTMIPGEVTTTVVEHFDGDVKSEVQIKNTGNTDAYIRAAVIVTWQDTDGNVYGEAPVKGSHYTMSLKTGENDGWIEGSDGFYYHKAPVGYEEDDNLTKVLIDSCTTKKETQGEELVEVRPEGLPVEYKLCVEIIASAIQANGVTDDGDPVVVAEWGVTLDGGNITARPAVSGQ